MKKTAFLCRVKQMFSKVPSILLLPLGGVLTALCLVFPKIGFLEWLAMVPALVYLFSRIEKAQLTGRKAYQLGLLYFYSFYLVIWHWFIDLYPMEFAGISKGAAVGLIAICWFGLSLVQTVFSALIFPVFLALSRTRLIKRKKLLFPFLFASVYTVSEWSQTLTWAGVPWARLAIGQTDCGFLLHGISLFGSYFLTFALVAVNALAAYAILHLDRVKAVSMLCAAVFAINLVAGTVGYLTAPVGRGEGVVVAAVQGNVGSANKWDSNSAVRSKEIYEQYTAKAAAAGAKIVVFPETFIPYSISENSALGMYVRDLAKKYQVTIRCGAFYNDFENDKYYNGLFTAYPDGTLSQTVYAKRRLVPFGEFVPMRPVVEFLLPVLADMGMLDTDLDAGHDSAIVTTEAGDAGSLICFDSIYETLTLDAVRDGATYICLSTNDSWFLDSAGIYMHHRQARLRAVESGRYIIRSADTGISAIISPDGTAMEEQGALVDGVSIATIYPSTSRTLYSYMGNLPVYLLIAAELALAADALITHIRRKRVAVAVPAATEEAKAPVRAENKE
ncbi:MAG: apolipoprotein N-acyltransferase [Ruminococcaceae bacterium]|nr:apolipoprotein N-acyltransferase [Oscillospiraceae bacterium]